jgi:hypothetical protein
VTPVHSCCLFLFLTFSGITDFVLVECLKTPESEFYLSSHLLQTEWHSGSPLSNTAQVITPGIGRLVSL